MNLTKQTNRFALFFFLYFLVGSFLLVLIPGIRNLPYVWLMILSQLNAFFIPGVLYFVWTKKSPKEVFRLRPLGWKNILLVIAITFAFLPIIAFLSYLTSLFFPNAAEESFQALQSAGFPLTFVAMAILPPLLEELTLRGIFLSGYRRLGAWQSIFFTALLFGMLHMNPQQFPYAFVAGLLFCFLVERTGSIWASIIPHFLVNASNTLLAFMPMPQGEIATQPVSTVATFLSSLFLVGLALPFLVLFLYLLCRINPKETMADGAGAKESFFTVPVFFIFILFLLLGILPYFLL